MALKYNIPIDLNRNQLFKLRIENVASGSVAAFEASSSNQVKGLIYFNDSSSKLRFYNGSAWQELGDTTGFVTSVSVSSPITNSGTGTAPIIGIQASSGAQNGYMSSAHYTLVNNATNANTASTIVKRDANGDFAARDITARAIRGIDTNEIINDTDGVNKIYVDTLAMGLRDFKESVVCTTTTNVNLSTPPATFDGVTLSGTYDLGARVLIKDQTDATQNGIWIWNGTGSPMTRATDADTTNEMGPGCFVYVEEGTTYGDTGWTLTSDDHPSTFVLNVLAPGGTTTNSSDCVWTQFSGANNNTAGNGLSAVGRQFNVNVDSRGSGTATTQIVSDEVRIHSAWAGQNTITIVGTIATGTWQASTIAAIYGGTGQTSYAVGDILYASTTTALSKLAGVATGNALISGGVGTAPSWGKIGLTTHVSGLLPLANGGTGANLSATGGTGQYVKQAGVGAVFTVGTIAAADLPGSFSGFANPTATIGLTATNGSATTAMRSDAAPALSQAIAPTWTAAHTFQRSTSTTASTDGVVIRTSDAATALGSYKSSPNLTLQASVWTGSAAVSKSFIISNVGTGAANGYQLGFYTTDSPSTPIFVVTYDGKLTFDRVTAGIWNGTAIGVQYGGSGTNLSATGGTGQYVKQVTVGGSFSVGTIAAADLPGSFAGFADPATDIGLTATNGVATTAMRSDAAPALSQAIAPTWTAEHIWSKATSDVTQWLTADRMLRLVTTTPAIGLANNAHSPWIGLYANIWNGSSSVQSGMGIQVTGVSGFASAFRFVIRNLVSSTDVFAIRESGNITMGTVTSGTWNGTVITGTYGGTGVNNGSNTITVGGNVNIANAFSTSGAFAVTLTATATTNVTLPTTGTLATLAGTETFTNKTITSPRINQILDTNGATALVFSATASAVNHIQIGNQITGSTPQIAAVGSDTNIGILLVPKGLISSASRGKVYWHDGAANNPALSLARVWNFLLSTATTMRDNNAIATLTTSVTIKHMLNNQYPKVVLINVSTLQEEVCDVTYTDADTVTLGFTVAPSNGDFRVTIIG